MIELDGKEYLVATPAENTASMLSTINTYCANHDVRNSKNELVVFEENFASPLYLILFGVGYLATALQSLVYSLGCAFSIPSASEHQLLNLADLANVDRGKASRTTVDILVYAEDTLSCEVTVDNSVTLNNVLYKPAFDLRVEAGGVGHLILIAQEEGSFIVSEGVMEKFDDEIIGLKKVIQKASIAGKEQESIESLRERVQRRTYSGTNIDAAEDAIRALEGVTLCSIYFNDEPSMTKTINGITVAPRTALLFVQGYSSEIAKTFYQHLSCKTNKASDDRTLTQIYTSHSEQEFPVYIITPAQIPCYIRVYVNQLVTTDVQAEMKEAIQQLALELSAGQTVSSQMILNALESDFSEYELQGAEVGKNSISYNYKQTPEADELFVINAANIDIVMPSND